MTLRTIVRIIALLAVLLAPATMMASHAAAAAPGGTQEPAAAMTHAAEAEGAMADHCPPAGDEQPGNARRNIDCIILCAALPAAAGGMSPQPGLHALVPHPLSAILAHGLEPAADVPPPRFS